MEEIIRKYNKEEAEVLRKSMIKEIILPYIEEVFKKNREFNSVTFLVAQYWCDEALDAVHYDFIFSILERPDVEAHFHYIKSMTDENWMKLCDETNTPGLNRKNMWETVKDHKKILWEWPDNTDAIPAFAAFTTEGANQEMEMYECYSPYANFFRTKNGGVDYEVVGEMHRPWLDGVYPDWERKN